MSKANLENTTTPTRSTISRRSVLKAGGGIAAGVAISAAPARAAEEPLWPEFRQWYAFMLKAEQIHIRWAEEEADADDDRYNTDIEKIVQRMYPLEETMRARQPRSEVNRAALACLALYWVEKERDRANLERYLVIGCSRKDSPNCFDPAAAALIEAMVASADERGLLPGVKIWREGAWATSETI